MNYVVTILVVVLALALSCGMGLLVGMLQWYSPTNTMGSVIRKLTQQSVNSENNTDTDTDTDNKPTYWPVILFVSMTLCLVCTVGVGVFFASYRQQKTIPLALLLEELEPAILPVAPPTPSPAPSPAPAPAPPAAPAPAPACEY